ncbi:MAG: DoxX family protein [Deltaproteobacteria bacterium]|nr:DoxX family protein [Deltaproteobacteria bacterium]
MEPKQPNLAVLAVVGRALLALIFIMSGFTKIFGFRETMAYMAAYGMWNTNVFLVAAIAVELVGGLSILVGWKARAGAFALIAFLLPVTIVFHRVWGVPPGEQHLQLIQLLKNVSILGGLTLVTAFGAGPISVDAWLARRKSNVL